jgi:hypothetical protein
MEDNNSALGKTGRMLGYIFMVLGVCIIGQAFYVGTNIYPNFEWSLSIGIAAFLIGLLIRILEKRTLVIIMILVSSVIVASVVLFNMPGSMDYMIVWFILAGLALVSLMGGIVVLVKYIRFVKVK